MMIPANVRCVRCGYAPMVSSPVRLRVGSACPQCAAPLGLSEPAVISSARDSERPVGREDRDAARAEAARRPKKAGSALGKLISIAVWIAIIASMTGKSPTRLLQLLQERIEAFQRGGPVAARSAGPGDPDAFTPPADFQLLQGTWMGSASNAPNRHWTFRFSPPSRAQVTEADGTDWQGEARVYWERGAEGGLNVLPGGYPLDLQVARPGGAPPAILLGTYRLQGADSMQLCLGRPDGLDRTSEFRSTKKVSCWSLVRTGREP
jgi:hypothetical protein